MSKKAPAIVNSKILKLDWPEILQVSHSRIKSWRRCQMQHHYRYYQGLRKIKKPMPLFLGSAIHSMIEAHHERGNWDEELAEFRREYDHLFQEEKAELGDLPTEIAGILEGYLEHYHSDGLTYPKRRKGRATEIRVLVDLDVRTRFLAVIDAIPEDAEGRVWVMDHKSVKSIPDEAQRFADLQLVSYVWLLPLLGYPKPTGVIWDYIRKKAPSVPEKLKDGSLSRAKSIDTTYSVYMQTVVKLLGTDRIREYEAFAQTLKGREEKFYRRIYLPNPSQVMIDNVVKDIFSSTEAIRIHGPGATERNMTRDCKQCSYYNLCQAEVRGLDSEFIRKTEYTSKDQHDQEEVVDVGTEE